MPDKIEITPEFLADLKARAENANPGPWIFDLPYSVLTLKESWPICDAESCNDAIFIAAANPATILELLAEMQRMKRRIDWDTAALQAYGAMPEDMKVCIEDESFAWHLNRIKTGLGKRLEFAEKRLEDCLRENERLEKEADWLAAQVPRDEDTCAECMIGPDCDTCRIKFWRKAAQKATREADNG